MTTTATPPEVHEPLREGSVTFPQPARQHTLDSRTLGDSPEETNKLDKVCATLLDCLTDIMLLWYKLFLALLLLCRLRPVNYTMFESDSNCSSADLAGRTLLMQDICSVLRLVVQQTIVLLMVVVQQKIILLMVFAVCSNGTGHCHCCKALVVFCAHKKQNAIQNALMD